MADLKGQCPAVRGIVLELVLYLCAFDYVSKPRLEIKYQAGFTLIKQISGLGAIMRRNAIHCTFNYSLDFVYIFEH